MGLLKYSSLIDLFNSEHFKIQTFTPNVLALGFDKALGKVWDYFHYGVIRLSFLF